MSLQLLFILVVMVTTPLVWLVPRLWRSRVMMISTLIVLLFVDAWSVALMLSVAALQWALWNAKGNRRRHLRLATSILLPLLPLVVYKLGHKIDNWVLPLGLSYFAFRQIHVAFESYKNQLTQLSLEEYFRYLLFLPVMLVGPIHRIQDMQRSLRRHKWQAATMSEGFERLLYGLVKINFLGNYLFSFRLSKAADYIDNPTLKLYSKTLSFACNAYFQFSGFSDLAIGMGLLWGIKVMENFHYPFLATNMQAFWTRWHISLSTWCRDYVFHPILAKSRNRWLALALSMLVLALWHEISWQYIAWGVFHAVLILLTILLQRKMPSVSNFLNENSVGRWIGRVLVVHLFVFSCLFLMANDFADLRSKLHQLFW